MYKTVCVTYCNGSSLFADLRAMNAAHRAARQASKSFLKKECKTSMCGTYIAGAKVVRNLKNISKCGGAGKARKFEIRLDLPGYSNNAMKVAYHPSIINGVNGFKIHAKNSTRGETNIIAVVDNDIAVDRDTVEVINALGVLVIRFTEKLDPAKAVSYHEVKNSSKYCN